MRPRLSWLHISFFPKKDLLGKNDGLNALFSIASLKRHIKVHDSHDQTNSSIIQILPDTPGTPLEVDHLDSKRDVLSKRFRLHFRIYGFIYDTT